MRHIIFLLMLLVSLPGCSWTDYSEALQGEWKFAYLNYELEIYATEMPQYPPPPFFDRYIFSTDNTVEIISTIEDVRFTAQYKVSADRLRITFQSPEREKPILIDMPYTVDQETGILTLIERDTKYQYYRPEKLLPNDLAGRYTTKIDGQELGKEAQLILGKNGEYSIPLMNMTGYYVLWPSDYGNLMSIATTTGERRGLFAVVVYEKYGDMFKATPILPDGSLHHDGALIWTKIAEE